MFLIDDLPLPHGPYSATTRLSLPCQFRSASASDSANDARPNKSSAQDATGRSAEKPKAETEDPAFLASSSLMSHTQIGDRQAGTSLPQAAQKDQQMR
jgi:hypothetical protein